MTILPELQADFDTLNERWRNTAFEPWRLLLAEQLERGMSASRYGDIPRWREALGSLPELAPSTIELNASEVGCLGEISDAQRAELESALRGLQPWRKGPFNLFGVHIDTEWRSDLKWNRLLPGLRPLIGKRVLDVGCGSGYHCWRMLGAGADEVIGIEPTPLFVLQFKALQRYLQQPNIHVLPAAMEHLPRPLKAFDSVFSMGVLYHRRSPMDHLNELKDALVSGGQLILETLVIDGDAHSVLVPAGRYSRMGNVWFLPSTLALAGWLKKLGFQNVELIDCGYTTADEQRSTDWMTFHSLAQFLDPTDSRKTVEGYPAPQRAILVADAP